MFFRRYYTEKYTEQQLEAEKKIFRHSLLIALFVIIAVWIVFLAQEVYRFDYWELGIYPLKWKGLAGILTSPFVHGGYRHIGANTLPLFLLTLSLFYFYRNSADSIVALIYICSGICVWLLARGSWHIGASGLIYGLASFLILSGIIRNNSRLLTISLVVVMIYGGIFWGVLPLKPEISWESHLWGTVSGVIFAIVFRNYGPPTKIWEWNDEEELDEVPEENNVDEAINSFLRPE